MQPENQEIPQQNNSPILQEPAVPDIKPKGSKKKWVFMGIIFLVIIGLAAFLFTNKIISPQTFKSSQNPAISQAPVTKNLNNLLKAEDVLIPNVLVPYVPHFDNLLVTDLPSSFDIRFVGKYKNNLIIAGTGGIMEYDPAKQQVVRVQDNRIFNCNFYFAMVGKYLYAACNEVISPKESYKSKGRSIYKLDLETGSVVKRYFEYKIVPNPEYINVQNDFPDFTNLNIVSLGTTIWGGVQNGVFSIDTATDKVNYYTEANLGFEESCPWVNIWSNQKFVWMTPQASECKKGVTVFDPSQNKLVNYSSDQIQEITGKIANFEINTAAIGANTMFLTGTSGIGGLDKYIIKYNLSSKNWDLIAGLSDFPSSTTSAENLKYFPDAYFPYYNSGNNSYGYLDGNAVKKTTINFDSYNALSNLVNGKYYILGDRIYTIKKNSFPKVFSPTTIPEYDSASNIYVSSDEKYMLIPQNYMGGPNPNPPPPKLILLDLKSNKYVDLLKDKLNYDKLSADNKKIFDDMSNFKYSEKSGVVIVKGSDAKELFSVNLSEQSLNLNNGN